MRWPCAQTHGPPPWARSRETPPSGAAPQRRNHPSRSKTSQISQEGMLKSFTILGLSLIRNIYRFDNQQNYYRYATSIQFSDLLTYRSQPLHMYTHSSSSGVNSRINGMDAHSCSGELMCCSSCVFLKNSLGT